MPPNPSCPLQHDAGRPAWLTRPLQLHSYALPSPSQVKEAVAAVQHRMADAATAVVHGVEDAATAVVHGVEDTVAMLKAGTPLMPEVQVGLAGSCIVCTHI